ncbi:LysE/ArgO family amino acid transporter [Actinotalea sp. AC32]|nr:LysE/ArgO family amino acid transporter [Actinotalea sp. AC32]
MLSVAPVVLTGLVTGLSLIVAIGAQNAWVLRQGLLREHVGPVVAICAVSDAVLVAVGVAGMGAVVDRHPGLVDGMRWIGAAYLAAFGLRSLWSARRPGALEPARPDDRGRLRAVVGVTLALTWLNPHVYLDTVLLLGSLAQDHGADRWWFAAGALVASALWFTGLGFGARWASRWARRPSTWRVLDVVVGVVMLALAVGLVAG